MTVRDGIGRARFHAITAEDASRVIDVVHAGVALTCGNSVRVDVLRGLDINAICGAGSRAQEAANTLFQSAFVAMQDMDAAVARLEMYWLERVVFRDRLTEHVAECYAKTLHPSAERLPHFPNDPCHILPVLQTRSGRGKLAWAALPCRSRLLCFNDLLAMEGP